MWRTVTGVAHVNACLGMSRPCPVSAVRWSIQVNLLCGHVSGRLTFQTAQYQASATASGAQAPTGLEERLYRAEPFFPQASVVFKAERGEHYHVPLTWSPFGYSTYRGS